MEEMVERDHINNHPLIKHIGAGKLTIDQLRGFAKQFYFVGPKPTPSRATGWRVSSASRSSRGRRRGVTTSSSTR